jgi:saccharopine dehydrogenase-like NADP-dependent oxidoreductase
MLLTLQIIRIRTHFDALARIFDKSVVDLAFAAEDAGQMKILLLGAGHIGQTIARLLSETTDFSVTVVDESTAALAHLGALRVATSPTSIESPEFARLLRAHDAVINALPYYLAARVATLCRETGCHYFDLTEDVDATRRIRALADGAPMAFMPQCGLAPGFIGIVGHHLAKQFDVLHEVRMRVGALPAFPTNALKYNLTWSVDGLINEYCHPCEAIRDGEAIEVLALEGLEHFSLDGVEYEAFNTSGGLGTLCETLAGKVRSLDYKSVRYPGHRDLMQVLLDEFQLKSDPAQLKALLQRAVPTTMQDVVLVFVTVTGLRGEQLIQEVFARKIFADRTAGHGASAIQITTAAGVCAVVDLFREGRLPKNGFIRQEQVELPDFLANRFGAAYQQFRHVESIG